MQDTAPTGLLAETFTAGRSGRLDTATLYLQAFTPGTATVGLFAIDGSGAPTTPLATTTGTVTAPFGPLNLLSSQYAAFTFAAPATVVAGQKYGLVIMAVHPDALEVVWAFQQPPTYTGGQEFGTFSHDVGGPFEPFTPLAFDFQTFVTPPATPTPSPSAASITGVAQAGFTLAPAAAAQPIRPPALSSSAVCTTWS